ncbi:iron ABC transporter permease [Virgibacillus halophilus]|uniref:Probable heme-iron transport system permease protein IsdF n=2 Tax=Tigheibacillus halophilus TaxID=361280 RepID=A0ABU5C3C2_9BACI|nr:iron ABC transporter permease [Virgibacillus halophilus]
MISFIAVILLLFVSMVYALRSGSLHIGIFDLTTGLLNGGNEDVAAIKDLRFPRILIATMAGACLSVSGALLQAVMRNPLAEAGIIGIAAGANFLQTLVISLFPMVFFFGPLFSFIGGGIAWLIVATLAWQSGYRPLRLILVGVAVHAIFTALNESLPFLGGITGVQFNAATTSTFTQQTWGNVEVMVIYGAIGLLLSFFVISWCNLLSMEDRTAMNLGMNVTLARIIVSVIAVFLASVSTSVAGVISFIGLLVPHIGRALVGSDYKLLIPFSALFGAWLLLLADTLGRTMLAPMEIPASVLMVFIGGPFLIIMLRRSEQVAGN